MPVDVIVGDLFKSQAQTLVNTVNTVGVMGKGVALEFKKRFPEMYADYLARCNRHEVRLGEPYLYRTLFPPWVLNFPTKEHWRSVARLDAIVQGLDYLAAHYRQWGIESLAVPPLGCGNGQLEWSVVGPTLYRKLTQLEIPIELYAPYGTPHQELQAGYLERVEDFPAQESGMRTHMHPGWVALVEVLRRLEENPLHWPVGRVSFQKIAYFATEAGIPTNLEYERGSLGPYAENVKRLISRLQNHGLVREEPRGRMIRVRVGPTYRDALEVYSAPLDRWNNEIERVVDLFSRLNTRKAEIVASVHYAYRELQRRGQARPTEREVFDYVMKWKERHRPPLDERDVAVAIRNLGILGWLTVTQSEELPIPEDAVLA